MSSDGISEEVRQFIFEHLDSVELLDALLLIRSEPEKTWTAASVASHLRANPASIANRLLTLKKLDLVEELTESEGGYRWRPTPSTLELVMKELALANKVRRHRVLELIFSPMKRARKFADAFSVRGISKRNDDG